MEQINEYFAMGGYAAFVWPAYAITAAVLAVVFGASLRSLRRTEAELARLQSAVRNDAPESAPGAVLSPAAGDGR